MLKPFEFSFSTICWQPTCHPVMQWCISISNHCETQLPRGSAWIKVYSNEIKGSIQSNWYLWCTLSPFFSLCTSCFSFFNNVRWNSHNKIKQLKGNNSVTFGTCTLWWNHHLHLVPKCFHLVQVHMTIGIYQLLDSKACSIYVCIYLEYNTIPGTE